MLSFDSARSCYLEWVLLVYYEFHYDEEDHEGEGVPTDLVSELVISHVCFELIHYYEGWCYAKEALHKYLDQTIGCMDFPTDAWAEVRDYRWNKKSQGPRRRLAFEVLGMIDSNAEKIQTKYREYLERRIKKRVLIHGFAPFGDCAFAISTVYIKKSLHQIKS